MDARRTARRIVHEPMIADGMGAVPVQRGLHVQRYCTVGGMQGMSDHFLSFLRPRAWTLWRSRSVARSMASRNCSSVHAGAWTK